MWGIFCETYAPKKSNITFEPYAYEEADLKNTCEVCGHNAYTWNIDGHYICKDCMSKEQLKEIVKMLEEILLNGDFNYEK